MHITNHHAVSGNPILPPFPEGMECGYFGMGCFWGAERRFWQCPGVFCTAVGYAGGHSKDPTYDQVCSGQTGYNEVVLVVFDPKIICYEALLKVFWEAHDPTQGMRQGNDIGSQYRSSIDTTSSEQLALAEASKAVYRRLLKQAGFGSITTEIRPAGKFYYAEDYHQQYLHKNPAGYCGLAGTGVVFEVEKKGRNLREFPGLETLLNSCRKEEDV